MNQLIANGEVKRGGIGVTLRSLSPASADKAGGNVAGAGAVIDTVEPQSPAAQAGLHKGGIVTAVNGVSVASSAQFRNLVGLMPVDSETEIRYQRGAEMVAGCGSRSRGRRFQPTAPTGTDAPPVIPGRTKRRSIRKLRPSIHSRFAILA